MSPWRVRWIKYLINPIYTGLLMFVNVIFTVFLIIADQTVYWKAEHFWAIMFTSLALNMIYVGDMVVNFVVLRPANVWKEKKFVYLELII